MGIFDFFKKVRKTTKWDIDYQQVNTPEKVQKYYTMLIESEPLNENLYVERGKAYESLKQYDLAIQDFNAAMKLNPQDSYFYYYLRYRQYEYLGEMEKALERHGTMY